MMPQTQSTRVHYRWDIFVACIVIIVCIGLLYWFSGGFSPGFWRFLGQAWRLPENGWDLAHLLPLVILLLFVFIILMMWIYLSIEAIKMYMQHRQNYHASQSFLQADRRVETGAEPLINGKYVQQGGIPAQVQSSWQEQDTAPMPSVQVRSATHPLGDHKNGKPADDVLLHATALSSAWSPQTWPSQADQLTVALPVTPQWDNSFYATLSYQPSIAVRPQNIISPDTDHREDEIILRFERMTNEITLRLERVTKDRPSPISHAGQSQSKEQGLVSDLAEETRLLVGVSRDVGIVRKDAPNEDALFALQGTRVTENESKLVGFFAVADGMGGYANGQEASHIAIQAMSDTVMPGIMRDVDGDDNFLELLREGVHQANQLLLQRNSLRQCVMGTTLTAALVVGRKAYIVNIGDSRTYIYRNGAELLPVTRDHSFVAYLAERGLITRDRIYSHPWRNQIYRSLGAHGEVEVDTFVEELHNGDVLLLCSDGLWEMVRDGDIQKIVASADHPTRISNMLMQTALDHGGEDNISVVVVRMACAESAR